MTGHEEIISEQEGKDLQKDNDLEINYGKIKETKNNVEKGEKVEDSVYKSSMHKKCEIQFEESKEQSKKETSENESEESTEIFIVQKGKGTPLKEIPNVVCKLENRNTSFLAVIHCILYGLNGEAEDFKENILQFSGFAQYNEENQKDKTKERLEKCSKDTLAQLCSFFDLPVPRVVSSAKKGNIIVPLLDFLEAPFAINNDNISDNEVSTRKRKLERTRQNRSKKKCAKEESEASSSLETSHVKTEEQSEQEEQTEEKDKNTLDDEKNSKGSDVNSPKKEEEEEEEEVSLKPNDAKSKRHSNRRVAEGGDKSPEKWSDPTCVELRKGICDILEKIDFTTTTFLDVLEKLDENFEMDLSARKDAIKLMIEEELYRLSDEAQENENNEEN